MWRVVAIFEEAVESDLEISIIFLYNVYYQQDKQLLIIIL